MPALPTELRNQLQRAITTARDEAEKGARSAVEALAVHHHEPHASMTAVQRELRNRLRAHGRQLGDRRDPKRGTQQIDRLVHECAYEHWHRMLFARFLAENHLLIEPTAGVAITMAECEELAQEQGEDPWTLASRYAQRMLPQIFRPDDPVLAVTLPPETRQTLERLVDDLPTPVFTADDSLGWTYQFWQTLKKKQVNESGVKIGADELPAVTQLFTEHYMVLFLLHNTIGAWHAGKLLAQRPELAASAASEQELRDAVALAAGEGYQFDYLRFVQGNPDDQQSEVSNQKSPWRPAAGTYDGWPREAKDLKVLDPCCGSGHFLVAAFELLVPLRIQEEGLSLDQAVDAVLRDNLFGLEIDPRCTQIAAFNLALAAWKRTGTGYRELPELHIACSGLAPRATREEWLEMAERTLENEPAEAREPIRRGLIHMHELFSDAPELGSLIDPNELPAEGFAADFETLRPVLDSILQTETADAEAHERAVSARGMAEAAQLLSGGRSEGHENYTLVITNVPYLGQLKQSTLLREFVANRYADGRADLASAFLIRGLSLLPNGCTSAVVISEELLFLKRHAQLRHTLLADHHLCFVGPLGMGSFQTPLRVSPMLFVLDRGQCGRNDRFAYHHLGDVKSLSAKNEQLS